MSFDVAIGRVLGNEGGYSLNPADPGGETIWGISRRSFPNFNGGDFVNAPRSAAVALYQTAFWDTVHADAMPAVLQFQVLDFAVNCGIGTAIRKLQAAAGVADDGNWGPITQAAVVAMAPAALVVRFVAEELDYRRKLSGWAAFGAGWTARVANDLRFAAVDILGATS